MKNKKLFISIIACTLALGVALATQSSKKEDSVKFSISTLDTAISDGTEIKVEDTQIVEIDEDDTPLAAIGKSNGKVRNLNSSELAKIRTNLLNSVNKERKTKAKNKKVAKYAKLEKTGNIRAKEIIKKWSHTRPNGKSWSTVLTSNGISKKNLKAGEDLAKISTNAKASYDAKFLTQLSNTIHTSLMNSPTHKKVILNQTYKKVGIGVYSEVKNGKLTVYVTEHFKN